ncbi:hypothetical protein SASPL_123283 [Salvia splendens]|uniref:NAC domain-containing protein n=1 Tax=Salvia splendens TaxID=180675 RepID=A0A8X8XMY0_SALSN|nr:hypothetical protein SASPL_123283 [Salvia splendens]
MGDHLEIRIEQGFELNPTPEKLIKGYLIPWVTGQNPTWNGVVEKAIYGDSFPWEIFSDIESLYHSKMEEKGAIKYTIFAFTTLVRARNSKRVSRKAGEGTWHGQTGPMKIEDSNTGFIIGQSKMFTFGNSGKADVGHWIMHEYSLSKELVMKSGRVNAADLVVCKITKTVQKKDKSLHKTNQFLSQETEVSSASLGVDRLAQPNVVPIVQQSDEGHAPLEDANKFLSPANEVPFANPGAVSILEPYYGGYELPLVESEMSYPMISYGSIVQPYCCGYEAPVPVPVPVLASPTVSIKRAAEVDLLRNGQDSDMKRQKCDGKDWMKEFDDLFASDFQPLMEAETRSIQEKERKKEKTREKMGDHLEIRIEQGFELNPTPEKLIKGYLIPWVTGQNPTWNGVVEKAIYGDSFPWEIFSDIESLYHSKMEEKGAIKYTIFAFTTLVRARNSKRVSRKAGEGTWHGQTGPMKIEDSNTGFIIGQSKMFTFGNSGKADVGHWIMHEYSLSKELVMKSGRVNAADLVVCKITKTVQKKDKSLHNTNQFLLPAYEVPIVQPGIVSTVQQSGAPLQPDAYKLMFPANKVQFANPGIVSISEPYYGGYEVPAVQPEMSYPRISDGLLSSIVKPYCGGYEAPVPVLASPLKGRRRSIFFEMDKI